MVKIQSSIGRRLEQSLNSFIAKDYESSLVHFFPALDKTAKIRRPSPKIGVGERIRGFLRDEEAFISFLAFRVIFEDARFDGVSFPEAIYKFGRTSIMHEGELDRRLSFENVDQIMIAGDSWRLSPSYIAAMITAVMAASENAQESFLSPKILHVHDRALNANEIWGKKAELQALIRMPYT